MSISPVFSNDHNCFKKNWKFNCWGCFGKDFSCSAINVLEFLKNKYFKNSICSSSIHLDVTTPRNKIQQKLFSQIGCVSGNHGHFGLTFEKFSLVKFKKKQDVILFKIAPGIRIWSQIYTIFISKGPLEAFWNPYFTIE